MTDAAHRYDNAALSFLLPLHRKPSEYSRNESHGFVVEGPFLAQRRLTQSPPLACTTQNQHVAQRQQLVPKGAVRGLLHILHAAFHIVIFHLRL